MDRKVPLRAGLGLISALLVAGPVNAYERPGDTQRVSLSSRGEEAQPILTGNCWAVAGGPSLRQYDISANGRVVAFVTDAPNLVMGDNNSACDVFVRDLRTGVTERVSQPTNGTDAIGACVNVVNSPTGSSGPSLSANGRYVAFHSCATNLVVGDTNGLADVFVVDRRSGSIERVSLTDSGSQILGLTHSITPSISSDGKTIAFVGCARDPGPGTATCGTGIWVRDLTSGTTELASPCSSELCSGGYGGGEYPSVSGNGRYVTYTSFVGGTDGPDTNATGIDVFRYDRKTKRAELVAASSHDEQGDNPAAFDPTMGTRSYGGRTISQDGRYVAFQAHANNLIPNDGNRLALASGDVFVRDMVTGRTERVSIGSSGQELFTVPGYRGCVEVSGQEGCVPSASYRLPALSGNGRFVMFTGGGDAQLVAHDRWTGATINLLKDSTGNTPGCVTEGQALDQEGKSLDFTSGALNGNGRFALFATNCENLVADDTNGHFDVFLRDIGLDQSVVRSDPRAASGGSLTSDSVTSSDPWGDVFGDLNWRAADILGARMVYRATLDDIYLRIDVDQLRRGVSGAGIGVAGESVIDYGFGFEANGRNYEVRVSTFAADLFRCQATGHDCLRVASLQAGYGSGGDYIATSIPRDALQEHGRADLNIDNVEAFSAVWSPKRAFMSVLDSVSLSAMSLRRARG